MKVVIGCGGTGGHVYPALSIADEIKKEDNQIFFIGKEDGFESNVIPARGYPFYGMKFAGIKRGKLLENIKLGFSLLKSYFKVRKKLKEINPDFVVGTGGYASFLTVYVAAKMKIPSYIHEQNAFPGFSNRMLEGYVRKVFLGFPDVSEMFEEPQKQVLVGNPVRKEFFEVESQKSDKNRLSSKQQIRRGNSTPKTASKLFSSQIQTKKKIVAFHPKSSKSKRKKEIKPNTKKLDLHLDPQEIARQLQKNSTPKNKTERIETKIKNPVKALSQRRIQALSKAPPFARVSINRQTFSNPGIQDFLPEIPDGDITLLNSKADRFAVFVRRVALQVFGTIRQTNWQDLPFSEIIKLRHFATIHVTMSPEGKLISSKIAKSSGSKAFDLVIKKSAKKGAWDQNPPSGATASDGNIHFVFQSRVWARGAVEGVREQRWILLGTGLL